MSDERLQESARPDIPRIESRLRHIILHMPDAVFAVYPFTPQQSISDAFAAPKAAGGVGVPAIVMEDGSIELDWEAILKEKGLPIVFKETNGAMCSLDGKGC